MIKAGMVTALLCLYAAAVLQIHGKRLPAVVSLAIATFLVVGRLLGRVLMAGS